MARNQKICLIAPDSSKRKRKTSIAAVVLTYANTPIMRSGCAIGPTQCELFGLKHPAEIAANRASEIQADTRYKRQAVLEMISFLSTAK